MPVFPPPLAVFSSDAVRPRDRHEGENVCFSDAFALALVGGAFAVLLYTCTRRQSMSVRFASSSHGRGPGVSNSHPGVYDQSPIPGGQERRTSAHACDHGATGPSKRKVTRIGKQLSHQADIRRRSPRQPIPANIVSLNKRSWEGSRWSRWTWRRRWSSGWEQRS
jgi:hypothetical protein